MSGLVRFGGAGKPVAKSATIAAGASGAVYSIARLLGSTSTLSLLSGTNPNLKLSAGSLTATVPLGTAAQTAIVREVLGNLAIEYPITLTGYSSTPTTPIGGDVPLLAIAPSIFGVRQVGSVLTAGDYLFTGSPTGYAFQWKRDLVSISNATGASYTLTSADIGHAISVSMTATNSAGTSIVANSASTAAITGILTLGTAPAPPQISLGDVNDGDASVNPGTAMLDTGSLFQQVSWTVVGWGSPYIIVQMLAPSDGVGGNGYFNTDLKLWGGDFSQGALNWAPNEPHIDWPVHPEVGDRVSVVGTDNGDVFLTLNGVEVPGSRENRGVPGPDATFLAIKLFYGAVSNLTYGKLGVPITLLAAAPTDDQRPSATVNYVAPTVAPAGFEIQVESLTGTVLTPWEPAAVVSAPSEGIVSVEGSTKLPEAYRGGQVRVNVRYSDDHTATGTSTLDYPSIKRFGTNISGHAYFDEGNGNFKDWFQKLTMGVVGGVYDNGGTGGANDGTVHQKLVNDGIMARDRTLLSWPTGADEISFGTIWHPAAFECGDRILKVGKGQLASITGYGGGVSGITTTAHDTSHPDYDTYTINFTPDDPDNITFYPWWIVIDKDTFVPGQTISLRHANDNTDDIVSDEFVAACSHLQVLRFMDALNTNNGGIWRDFNKDVEQGWSARAMVELINRTNTIPYFSVGWNVPFATAADYFAFFEAHINPAIPYFLADPSNEVWGGIRGITSAFAFNGAVHGRATNGGYGEPIDPAIIHRLPYTDDIQPGSGTGIGVTIPANEYIFQGIGGISYDALFRTTREVGPTDVLPQNDGNHGLAEADGFEIISGNMDEVAWREYGAFGRTLQLAVQATCPRVKMLINTQQADPFREGSTGYQSLTYAITEGGTDTWGAIVDGVAIAGYTDFDQTAREAINSANAGADRVAVMASILNPALEAWAGYIVPPTINGANSLWATLGRTGAPMMTIYECGQNLIWGRNDPDHPEIVNTPPGLGDDLANYFLLPETIAALEHFFDKLFALGMTNVCAYQFGPGKVAGADNIQYGFWPFYRTIDDTEGRAAAMIATGDKYRALAA